MEFTKSEIKASVDVIVPVYNGNRFIASAIHAIESQSYPLSQWIFVNDGSADNSLELLYEFAGTHPQMVVIDSHHFGLPSARNIGIRHSSSEWLAFLDVDDHWSPDKIRNQIAHVLSHPSCSLAYSGAAVMAEKDFKVLDPKELETLGGLNILAGKSVVTGSASSVLIRRDIFSKFGFFDESLSFGEDLELWVRFAKYVEFCRVTEVDVLIQKHATSMQFEYFHSRNAFRHNYLVLEILSRNFDLEIIEKNRSLVLFAFWGDVKRNLRFGLTNLFSLRRTKLVHSDLTPVLFPNVLSFYGSLLFTLTQKILLRLKEKRGV